MGLRVDYLDRNAIASTKLAGITTDLNLTGDEFQTAVSILFVGYKHLCVWVNGQIHFNASPVKSLPRQNRLACDLSPHMVPSEATQA
jgi:hypothetical protein